MLGVFTHLTQSKVWRWAEANLFFKGARLLSPVKLKDTLVDISTINDFASDSAFPCLSPHTVNGLKFREWQIDRIYAKYFDLSLERNTTERRNRIQVYSCDRLRCGERQHMCREAFATYCCWRCGPLHWCSWPVAKTRSRNSCLTGTWNMVFKLVLFVQSSSATAEWVLPLLQNSFNQKQSSSLEDYIETSIMLQYNRWCLFPNASVWMHFL